MATPENAAESLAAREAQPAQLWASQIILSPFGVTVELDDTQLIGYQIGASTQRDVRFAGFEVTPDGLESEVTDAKYDRWGFTFHLSATTEIAVAERSALIVVRGLRAVGVDVADLELTGLRVATYGALKGTDIAHKDFTAKDAVRQHARNTFSAARNPALYDRIYGRTDAAELDQAHAA